VGGWGRSVFEQRVLRYSTIQCKVIFEKTVFVGLPRSQRCRFSKFSSPEKQEILEYEIALHQEIMCSEHQHKSHERCDERSLRRACCSS